MLAPYRSVLATPGARLFSAAGFVARMPMSMVTLAIVLLVVERSGSYGKAGAISASYMLTAAVSSPLLGRLIDRWGQRRVLLPAALGFGAGLLALLLAVEQSAPTPLPHLCAAVTGAAYPPVGACVRARWTAVLPDPGRLHTAFSFEAVVDETVFMLGPVVITLLATQVSADAAMLAVAAVGVAGGLWLAALRATEPPSTGTSSPRSERPPLRWMWLGAMVVTAACLGSLFGATEVVTVAFAEEQGHKSATGPLLAIWALGSLISGVLTGVRAVRATPLRRYQWGATAMAAAMVPLPFVDNLLLMGVVLFLGGFSISPTLVATMSLVESGVPAARLTEGITWISTGIGFGIAPGAAIAGRLIDEFGASTAYAVPVASGLLAATVAWSTGRLRVATGAPAPATAVE